MARRKENSDLLAQLMYRLDEIRDATTKLHASFEAHLKQDEQFYSEVKEVVQSQNKIAERLSEYNEQLALHIAGVKELRRHTSIMEETQQQFIKESTARLERIEKPYVWAEFSIKLLKATGYVATVGAAAYGVIEFLASVGLF